MKSEATPHPAAENTQYCAHCDGELVAAFGSYAHADPNTSCPAFRGAQNAVQPAAKKATPRLEPCPFCGGAAGKVPLRRGHGFIVGCNSCQAQQFAMELAAAVEAWNTRAQSAAVDAVVTALKEVLRTGLNGSNNMRLAYIAAGGKALTPELLQKAEESEQAVIVALAAIAEVERLKGKT